MKRERYARFSSASDCACRLLLGQYLYILTTPLVVGGERDGELCFRAIGTLRPVGTHSPLHLRGPRYGDFSSRRGLEQGGCESGGESTDHPQTDLL